MCVGMYIKNDFNFVSFLWRQMKRFERLLDVAKGDPIIGGGGRANPFSPTLFFSLPFAAALFFVQIATSSSRVDKAAARKPVSISHFQGCPKIHLFSSHLWQGLFNLKRTSKVRLWTQRWMKNISVAFSRIWPTSQTSSQTSKRLFGGALSCQNTWTWSVRRLNLRK